MKPRRNLGRKPRPDAADENHDLNENAAQTGPLLGLAALRDSLPALEKKNMLAQPKPFQPRFRETPTAATAGEVVDDGNVAVGGGGVAEEEEEEEGGREDGEILSEEFEEAVRRITGEDEEKIGEDARPRVIMDVGGGAAAQDMLLLSGIPADFTYDRLCNLTAPFGEVTSINWDAATPDVAEVVYASSADAEEAMHYLNESILGGAEDEMLHAELKSRDGGTQLFVGDLSPSVTEEMLEEAFGKLVSGPVSATLKRDPGNNSTIGYGFMTFQDEYSAAKALLLGHRMIVGDVKVRVGRAERNTILYVSDLQPNVSLEELKAVFGQYGSLVEEDTVIVHRSYSFIRYRNRSSAENAKRALDKTSLRGKMTVRYCEAEPQKSTVQVQFHSQLVKPPASLKELLHSCFSRYGHCHIDIPRVPVNGTWRRTAFVQYHGDPIAAALAATCAVQNVQFVSSIPVLCQFSRELIPRVSPKNAAGGQQTGKCRKPFGGGNMNSNRRGDKNSNRDAAGSSSSYFTELPASAVSVNAPSNDGAAYPSYSMAGYPEGSASGWRDGGQNTAENRGRGRGGADFQYNSPGKRGRDTSRGKRGTSGDRRMGNGGMGAMGGMGRNNEPQQLTYMPVWVPAGHFSGHEMPSEFQASQMAPAGYGHFGPPGAPNIYPGQMGSPGGQYGMRVPVLPPSPSPLGMMDMGSGGFHAEAQPGNPQH